MKIILTGGAGFLGGHILNSLSQQDCDKIISIDRTKHRQLYYEIDNVYTVECDLRDHYNATWLTTSIKDATFIIHNACHFGDVKYCANNEYDILQINGAITNNVINVWKNSNAYLIYISSGVVTDGDVYSYSSEECADLVPHKTAYSLHKYYTERLIRAAAQENPQLKYTILRPSNILSHWDYDSQLNRTHLIPDLIKKLLSNPNKIQIYGDGSQIRDYIFAEDLSEIITKIIFDGTTQQLATNQVYNCTTSATVEVQWLIRNIYRLMYPNKPMTCQIEYGPTLSTDVPKRLNNNIKLLVDIQPKPFTLLNDEILKLMIDNERKYLGV